MRKLIAGVMVFVALDGSAAFAQEAGATAKMHPRSSLYVPLPPHQQPREVDAPNKAIEPTAKEKALDSKINNICRGC